MQVVIIGAGNWGTTLVGLINPAVPVRPGPSERTQS